MNAIIANIEISDLFKLSKELKGYVLNSIIFLDNMRKHSTFIIEDETIYRILKDSKYITFDALKDDFTARALEVEKMYNRSSIKDGKIENKLGLTEAEMWFNTLSDKEKEFVKNLSNNIFSNTPAC